MEPLTIQGAIDHCNEVAETACRPCADEHKQLAEWLTDLARYKQLEADGRLVTLPATEETDYDGLKVKYRVFKAKDNAPVENCFVLRPDKDEAAKLALYEYARNCGNVELARDIRCWLDGIYEAESALAKLQEGEK